MLVVWGRLNAVNVQKVVWCCEEIGIPFERHDAGRGFGVVDTADYRNMNPNGRVPTINDDGFVLWESNAIVRYLSRKHEPAGLLPADPTVAARVEQWMDWQIAVLWPPMRKLVLAHLQRLEGGNDAPPDDDRLKAAEAWHLLDAYLQDNAFVAGDRFSMGDIALGVWVWRWVALSLERPDLPNLQKWYARLAERPAYRKTVMQPIT
ncbi:glutathione S-transferase family protein [Devosia sp. A369]